MQLVESLYVASSATLVLAGLTLVGLAVRAYVQTEQSSMAHLSVGFGLVVAAAVTTVISAFVTDFDGVRSLLLVNSGFSTAGYVFVVYSLLTHE